MILFVLISIICKVIRKNIKLLEKIISNLTRSFYIEDLFTKNFTRQVFNIMIYTAEHIRVESEFTVSWFGRKYAI